MIGPDRDPAAPTGHRDDGMAGDLVAPASRAERRDHGARPAWIHQRRSGLTTRVRRELVPLSMRRGSADLHLSDARPTRRPLAAPRRPSGRSDLCSCPAISADTDASFATHPGADGAPQSGWRVSANGPRGADARRENQARRGGPGRVHFPGGRKLTSFLLAASKSSGVIRTTVWMVSPSLPFAASDSAAALWLSGRSAITYTSASPNAK